MRTFFLASKKRSFSLFLFFLFSSFRFSFVRRTKTDKNNFLLLLLARRHRSRLFIKKCRFTFKLRCVRCRWKQVRRLRRLLGSGHLRSRQRPSQRGVDQATRKRYLLRRAVRVGEHFGQDGHRKSSVRGNGQILQLRYRGVLVRVESYACAHRSREDYQV